MWERCGLGRPEGSRRCTAAGERAFVAAGVDYEEYWTLRLNWQGCLMCFPANNKHNSEENTVTDLKVSAVILLLYERQNTAVLLVPYLICTNWCFSA